MGFKWEKLQKYYGYSDEEMQSLRDDPHRGPATQKLFSPEIAQKYLVIRVVSSHGCTAGMKVGDKLVFRALGVLMPEKSSPWCSQAFGEIAGFANMAQDRFVSGLDPNGMVFNHFSCMDAGAQCGWGQVAMKVEVLDQAGLDSLDKGE
ncbi:MAG: hypothetical protein K9K65_09375 [Desulfarculaceae bacterium]|nr:hypothetical protein [Desulfarculaceae bacterium]MCF8047870.1 hypothetical protein [Desulfarculaceae bacterium]MCF8063994.1 hypothetical protein [Desulfarculaceae bacterium]MCF8098040.1 hypothetical protein [Desulfarculaceae bacterium]